ncbi:MAG: amidohydrolase [Betaproteobacteria bacterium]|nr:amidohydrolase [Betaproteobacteria bacterium]
MEPVHTDEPVPLDHTPMKNTVAPDREPLTIFTAKRIHTMDESLAQASAVAVANGRIVAVGTLQDMQVWCDGRAHRIDRQFEQHILLPGLIDNHIHPFLGALLMPTAHIAPEPWRQADGRVRPAVRTPQAFREALIDAVAHHDFPCALKVAFGYQRNLHGPLERKTLDQLFPDQPVIVIQRSFHEFILNSAALAFLGMTPDELAPHPQVVWEQGYFFENGIKPVLSHLAPHFMSEAWYHRGLRDMTKLMLQGGITTAADMLFGAIGPEYERHALHTVLEQEALPMRIVNVFDARSYAHRATQQELGPPDTPIDFAAGLPAMEAMLQQASPRIWFSRAIKLFADGAMFSQLMRMNPPGYIDGHQGEWLMSPDVLADGLRTFWKLGYQAHVHVNGDAGMDAVLAALAAAQQEHPRFDHRMHAHHVGYLSQAQTRRLAALGAHASVNPYYLHALGDDYSRFGLGPERAAQITRCGSLLREGMKLSFHSDFMMAPPEPLLLAWCAATRKSISGQVLAPAECLNLMQSLRAITIDAAWALHLDHEIGSIVAGKRADFCVLEDDPFELGVDGLKDVRVSATVFEGQPHWLPRAQASSLGPLQQRLSDQEAARPKGRGLWARAQSACCGVADRCDLARQWAGWLAPQGQRGASV